MRKSIYVLAAGMFLLTGCTSHDFGEVTPTEKEKTTQEKINENVKNVFGVEFSPNQNWSMNKKGETTFNVNSSVKTVQVVAYSDYYDESGEKFTKMSTLTETEVNNRSSIKLGYNVPDGNNVRLYAAFTTDESYYQTKIEGNTVSFADVFKSGARTRGEQQYTINYSLPGGIDKTYTVSKSVESFASIRNWIPGEVLYELSDADYDNLKMSVPASEQYDADFVTAFWNVENSYFPNKQPNLQSVINSGLYNKEVYPLTNDNGGPVIVSPVYKHDSGSIYGDEIYNSDLYYYYFRADAISTLTEAQQVEYIKSLPKYKAIPFNKVFNENTDTEDNKLNKNASYALLYFGDIVKPTAETKGSYIFPAGYHIGFMVRAKTDFEQDKKQGEVYGDGRLNDKINSWKNFASSKLGSSDPRVAWVTINGRDFLSWETGTDSDFNDILIEVQGVQVPPYTPRFPQVYTYCFEDRDLGDYDLNDVVITATRINATTLEYTLAACGAHDELYINGVKEWKDKEVHAMFGKAQTDFINTDPKQSYIDPTTIPGLVVSIPVPETFVIGDESDDIPDPTIFNKTMNWNVAIAKEGQDPHAILVPGDFLYPIEKQCVRFAYEGFNEWGQFIIANSWFDKPVAGKVYTKKPKKN